MDLHPKKILATDRSVKTLIVRAVLVVVLIGVQPWIWEAVTTRVVDFQQKRFQSDQIEQLHQRLGEIKQSQVAQQELLSQLDLVVPPKTSLAQVIERLERVAVERGVRIKISEIRDDTTSSGQTSIPVAPVTIAAQITGTSQQTLQYLDAIEHLQELTLVPDWSLTGSTTTKSDGTTGEASTTGPTTYTMSLHVTFLLQTNSTSTTNGPK